MEKIPVCWATNKQAFFVSWNEVPFQSRRTILWRGNVLHFEISSTEDAVTLIKVNYRNASGRLFASMKDHGKGHPFYYTKPLVTYDSVIKVAFSRNAIDFMETIPVKEMKDTTFDHPGLALPCPERVSFNTFSGEPEDHTLAEFNELSFNEKYVYVLCKRDVNYIAYRSADSKKYYLFNAEDYLIEMVFQETRIGSITGFPMEVTKMSEYLSAHGV